MAESNENQNKSTEKAQEKPLFPIEPGKSKPNYGTNNTLQLLERIPSQMVDLKLDEVVTAVNTVDNLCDYPKCKTRTSLMGQDCTLCKKRFCFKHGQPEVHGCAEAARKHERELFLHPKPLKTIRQEQDLEKAKKNLQSKLKEMQFERRQKQSGGLSGTTSSSNNTTSSCRTGGGVSSSGSSGGGKKKKK